MLRVLAHRVRDISQRETAVRDEHRRLRRVLEGLQPSSTTSRPTRISLWKFDGSRLVSRPVTTTTCWNSRRTASCSPSGRHGPGAPTRKSTGWSGASSTNPPQRSRPHELLAHLHQHMRRHGHPNVFMTLTLMILDVESLTADFAVGGPPCPLVYRHGSCGPFTDCFDWTLGYPFEGIAFHSETMSVMHGDTFLFYTDGLSEAVRGPDPERDTLGVDRLSVNLRRPVRVRTRAASPTGFSAAYRNFAVRGQRKMMPLP